MKKRATLKDVAREAGVSPATVSYVFNGKKSISKETQQRVRAAIEKLNYVPSLSARSLSTRGASKLIGVVIPQTEPGSRLMFENSFYSEIVGSIEYQARLRGYHVIISATDANESYLRLAQERNLEGIIVIGMYPDKFYQQMKESQIPIVLVDSYCNDHYYHNVRIDDQYGSYLATNYVLEQGHRNVAFFCGKLRDNGVMKKRLLGYKEALSEMGLPFRKDFVFEGQIDYDSGVEMAQRFAQENVPATAIVTAADILAIGVMNGLYESGVRVPDDVSVMGFDDLQISAYLTPGLTTVRQDISRKGEVAVELLFKNLQEPGLTKQEQILPLKLVERESIRRLPTKNEA